MSSYVVDNRNSGPGWGPVCHTVVGSGVALASHCLGGDRLITGAAVFDAATQGAWPLAKQVSKEIKRQYDAIPRGTVQKTAKTAGCIAAGSMFGTALGSIPVVSGCIGAVEGLGTCLAATTVLAAAPWVLGGCAAGGLVGYLTSLCASSSRKERRQQRSVRFYAPTTPSYTSARASVRPAAASSSALMASAAAAAPTYDLFGESTSFYIDPHVNLQGSSADVIKQADGYTGEVQVGSLAAALAIGIRERKAKLVDSPNAANNREKFIAYALAEKLSQNPREAEKLTKFLHAHLTGRQIFISQTDQRWCEYYHLDINRLLAPFINQLSATGRVI